MRPFAGERFWVITETNDYDERSEQMRFSEQLTAALVAAGWIKDKYPLTVTKTPLPMYRSLSTRGIEVGFRSGSTKGEKIAKVLVSGLTAANIECMPVAFTDLETGIVINVGLR